MRLILYCCFMLVLGYYAQGQSKSMRPVHTAGIEIGKLGPVLNLMYDVRFSDRQWGLRAVAGFDVDPYVNVYQAGAGIYYLIGKKKHSLETGIDFFYYAAEEVSDDQLALGFLFAVKDARSLYTSGNLGYRYTANKSIIRIGISQGYLFELKNYYTGAYISFAIKIGK